MPDTPPHPTLSPYLTDVPPSDADERRWNAGEALTLPTDKLWFLHAGDVTVYRAGRPIEVWSAPHPLDLAGSVQGTAMARFVAASDVHVVGVPKSALSGPALCTALARESAQLWARIEVDARRDDDTFLPWAVPVPGPWWFQRATGVVMVMQGDDDRIRACLPRGLTPLPKTRGRYLLAMTRFDGVASHDARDSREFSYHEVTPFLPVWSRVRGPATFIPELYPDAWMAVLLGREIHGFPKRTARVGLRDDGAELIVDRRLAVRARWGKATSVAPDAAFGDLTAALTGSDTLGRLTASVTRRFSDKLRFAALVRKRIGSPRTSGRTFEIDRVTRVPVRLDAVRSAEVLHDVTADIPGGPGILHGQALSAWRLETGFHFGPGRRELGVG